MRREEERDNLCVCETGEKTEEREKWVDGELFSMARGADMRAVVHDLLPLFAEQQSIQLPTAVLICPTCLHGQTHTHT